MSNTPAHWQGRGFKALLLLPVAAVFGLLSACRRWCYRAGLLKTVPSSIPVIVVGNISVGGTGKSPLTQALMHIANKRGVKAGIVSRGHGGQAHSSPYLITDNSTTGIVGDEPMMHFYQTGGPVVVCTDRSAAVATLKTCGVDLAISDDGLQHYRMQRSTEIAVVDGEKGFSNGLLLPSGPLREPVSRLNKVDIIAVQVPAGKPLATADELVNVLPALSRAQRAGVSIGCFSLQAGELRQLWTNDSVPLEAFAESQVYAVAGIGSPTRFFSLLVDATLIAQTIEYEDHHVYQESDLSSLVDKPVIVTGKDAVKLRELSLRHVDIYQLDVLVELSDELEQAIQNAI